MNKLLKISLELSVLIGTIVGILTDNIGLWVALGLAIGSGLKYRFKKEQNETNK